MGANTNEIPANPKEIAIANNITASIDMSINLKTSLYPYSSPYLQFEA